MALEALEKKLTTGGVLSGLGMLLPMAHEAAFEPDPPRRDSLEDGSRQNTAFVSNDDRPLRVNRISVERGTELPAWRKRENTSANAASAEFFAGLGLTAQRNSRGPSLAEDIADKVFGGGGDPSLLFAADELLGARGGGARRSSDESHPSVSPAQESFWRDAARGHRRPPRRERPDRGDAIPGDFSPPVATLEDLPQVAIGGGSDLTEHSAAQTTIGLYRMTGNFSQPLTVHVAMSGTATEGVDYQNVPDTVTFAAYATFMPLQISIIDDADYEGSESITATIVPNPAYAINSPGARTITLHDNDPSTVVTIAAVGDAEENDEFGPAGEFLVSRTGSTAQPLNVYVAMSGTATEGTDYGDVPSYVTIPVGQSSAPFSITGIDDGLIEGDESIRAAIQTSAYYGIGTPADASITLYDDEWFGPLDWTPIVTVHTTDPSAFESVLDPGAFEVRLDEPAPFDVTVYYGVSGTATMGSDFASLSGSVTVAAGLERVAVPLSVINDSVVDGTETVVLTLVESAAYGIGEADAATVSIFDDDPTPSQAPPTGPPLVQEVFVIASDPDAHETGQGTGEFTFYVSTPTPTNLTVFFSVAGTATAALDYYALGSSILIPAGQTSSTRKVIPLDELLAEDHESVIVTLQQGSGYIVGQPQQATVFIHDEFAFAGAVEPPNMTIHHGQGGAAVEKEEELGAATVANLNDTDGDGVVDKNDTDGVLASDTGVDEVDLMKLILHETGGMTTLSYPADRVVLWEESTRETKITPTIAGTAQFDLSAGDKTIWVEVIAASETVADITMTMTYLGKEDVVKATGVWAALTAVEHNRKSAEDLLAEEDWEDMSIPPKNLVLRVDGTGLLPVAAAPIGVRNAIIMRFTVQPSGIREVTANHVDEFPVRFDVSRRVESKTWIIFEDDTEIPTPPIELPEKLDEANDEGSPPGNHDETNEPLSSGHMFSYDGPGRTRRPVADEELLVHRLNAEEFVRVGIGGDPEGNGLSGSRASEKFLWHFRQRLEKNADGEWERTSGDTDESTANDVAQDHIDLGEGP